MQFNSVKPGSFLIGAKSVTDKSNEIYETAMDTKLNVGAITKQHIASQANLNIARERALRKVGSTALDQASNKTVSDIYDKANAEVDKILKPARMAGALAAGTASISAGYLQLKEDQLRQQEKAAYNAERKKVNDAILEMNKSLENQAAENKKINDAQLELLEQKIADLKSGVKATANNTSASISSPTTTTTTGSSTSNSINPSPKQAFDYMKSLGVSDIHAKGILANIQGESGFRTGVKGDGGESGGLFQMHADRFTKMINAVPNWNTDWKGQIKFALQDDTAPQYLKTNFNNPVEAADWFLHNFERPNKVHRPGREKLNRSFIGSLQF